ncbi:hypothetical protein JOF53_007351 [Crossiella equi]|uniref:Uncharacterized protein n=1 Tax=Crossiella equi TaxID=130796 RepID=A0ABS5AQI4_9PSEU|nr:hypothetical protein [Crossiella equi]MBP2478479.1 hypothetical protein [Crossiella equi]
MPREFVHNLRSRVAAAEAAVREARAAGADHRAEAHAADLANLRRLATEHGVRLPEPADG